MRSLLFFLLSLGLASAHEEDIVGFTFSMLEGVRLPKPLSDFTISFDETSQIAYIAGGCDAEQGNVYLEEIGTFVCFSSSTALYAFDRSTNSFQTLAPMPVARYRHGAALLNGKIWLLGGRDTEADVLLPTVDVSTAQHTIGPCLSAKQSHTFHSLQYFRSMILRLTHGPLTILLRSTARQTMPVLLMASKPTLLEDTMPRMASKAMSLLLKKTELVASTSSTKRHFSSPVVTIPLSHCQVTPVMLMSLEALRKKMSSAHPPSM